MTRTAFPITATPTANPISSPTKQPIFNPTKQPTFNSTKQPTRADDNSLSNMNQINFKAFFIFLVFHLY